MPIPPKAIILDGKSPETFLKGGLRVKEMYFLVAVVNSGEGVQFRNVISRDDGTVIPMCWENGKNIAPILGAWEGALTNELSPPIKGWTNNENIPYNTKVARESTDRTARIFLTSWKNENEWLPVRKMKLSLEDKNTTVLILGISALSFD